MAALVAVVDGMVQMYTQNILTCSVSGCGELVLLTLHIYISLNITVDMDLISQAIAPLPWMKQFRHE